MEAIICEGKNGEVDATIKYLQRMFEKRTPAVPVARLGGQSGLRMSRAAFAVMIKFSDLLEDFKNLVDEVTMQAEMVEEGADKEAAIIDFIRGQKGTNQSDMVISKWESAARMRQWINEKKLRLIQRFDKQVAEEVMKKKKEAKEKSDEAAKAGEKDEALKSNEAQIDSSTDIKRRSLEELKSEWESKTLTCSKPEGGEYSIITEQSLKDLYTSADQNLTEASKLENKEGVDAWTS
jgi:hypothetical protein